MSVLSLFSCATLEKICFSIVLFSLFFLNTSESNAVEVDYEQNDEKISWCDENIIKNRDSSKRLIFVSTLNGEVTALDLLNDGKVAWNVPTEPGDLLSSSIHKLEMTSNGKYVRMIPSLQGGLYKFDGDSIEAIPVKAEDLLKSSFKFSDDMVISGGNEVRTYGVNCRTGNVVYEQSMTASKNWSNTLGEKESAPVRTDHDELLDDILVVKRHTQTVRANEPRTGSERWNFSIGHHELQLALSDNCRQTPKTIETEQVNELIHDIELRVIVPEGLICGYSKKNPSNILWKHKFDAPIVSVYRSDRENQLYSVDLFANARWLWEEHGNDFYVKATGRSDMSPSIYLGMYQQQLYIQESDVMRSVISHHKELEKNLITDETGLPKIPFKPIPAANNALIEFVQKFHDEKDVKPPEQTATNDENKNLEILDEKLNAQAVLYASPYADGRGFYFFTEKDINYSTQCLDKNRSKKIRDTDKNPQEVDNITFQYLGNYPVRMSLMFYWKEITVIALTTALIINIMLRNQSRRGEREVVFVPIAKDAIEFEEEEQKIKEEIQMIRNEAQAKLRSISESAVLEEHYQSRFLADFDLIQCLGKGGFGVVFEVRNKLDDCNYAVKRILLPSKQESRDRVLREVKTLANCEHKNIVRYFHAWVEQPPKGWQEQKDRELLNRDIFSTSITIESPSPTDESKAFSSYADKKSMQTSSSIPMSTPDRKNWLMNLQKKEFSDFSEEKPGIDLMSNDSCSFIQFKADTNDPTESKNEKEDIDDESFGIEFKNSSCTMDNDKSHVISITNETSASAGTENKLHHRRNLSLDLTAPSNALAPKKLNGVVASENKMYLYIQMQLCMKTSLKDWLKEKDLKDRIGETTEVWSQIIEAVEYVHLKGLIHRDLKPSNIFFALDGQIKIGDFGLVTDMAEIPVDPLTSSSSNSNSSTNMEFDFTIIGHKKHTQRVGTSLYMSPEQARGLAYNYKVDIYSLGLIFFELLNYFHTETERYKVLQNLKSQKYPDEFINNFQDEFDLLQLMLSKSPEKRPTTYGIKARAPLNKLEQDQVSSDWHFELPTRRRDSYRSITNLNAK